MRPYTVAILGVLMLTGAGRAQGILNVSEEVRNELQHLQGNWRVETEENDGVKIAAAALKGAPCLSAATRC